MCITIVITLKNIKLTKKPQRKMFYLSGLIVINVSGISLLNITTSSNIAALSNITALLNMTTLPNITALQKWWLYFFCDR